MMRQYELVERVAAYNPERRRGSAEPRLCLRHAEARLADARLRRPVFLPSPRSRGDPDRPAARRRVDRRGAPPRHDRGYERDARRDRPAVRAGDRASSSTGSPSCSGWNSSRARRSRRRTCASSCWRSPTTSACSSSSSPTGCTTCARSTTCPRRSATRIAEETMEIYAPLAGRMGMQSMRDELEDLLLPGAAIRKPMRRSRASSRSFASKTGPLVEIDPIRPADAARQERHRGGDPRAAQKRPYSIFSKMQRKSIGFEQLSDIFGFRVLVDTEEDCYRALGVVHTAWPMVPGRFKDYISTPKQNEYRSLHTTIIGPQQQRVELQIRTRDDGRRRRIRHRRPSALQGRHRRRPRPARGGKPRLCLAAADGRADRPGRRAGGIPRAHQARALPGPGVLLHAEGPADRPAARRDADRLRLCRPHRRRRHLHRRQGERAARAARCSRCRTATRWRSSARTVQRPPAAWESIVVTGKARAAIRRASRSQQRRQYAALGRHTLESALRAGRKALSCRTRCRPWRRASASRKPTTCSRPSGAAQISADAVLQGRLSGFPRRADRQCAGSRRRKAGCRPAAPV